MKLAAGQTMENFTFDTAFESNLTLRNTAAGKKMALVFLRYYGCTLCQYDIHLLAEGYGKIEKAGGRLLVVLQSKSETIRRNLKPGQLPFPIVCDPDQALYRKFDIKPAAAKEGMGNGNVMEKVNAAKAIGFSHGEYEGEELQLPATFVVDEDLRLTYVRYGADVADVPTVEQLAELISKKG